ncbi:MAG: glycosyltransferase [Candidatus Thermoplasmatota archaeon]|nr:glycosyltransferase [Candidatus Thermoplasmatota archaeon]MCL5730702.1 glycosyltransferase [Candidatus Thermoplasmatota archaeon]
MSISVVIPAYNEENRIRNILEPLTRYTEVSEIIVVCDGNDRTPDVASAFPRVKVLKFSRKLGKGGAIIEGIRASTGTSVAYVDADGAIPASEVMRLINLLGSDRKVIAASRWVKGSDVERHEGLGNIIAGRFFHYLLFYFLGIKIKDTQCGLKCFPGTVRDDVIPHIGTTNRFFDVSFLYNCQLRGYSICEVGIKWSHNEDTRMPIRKAVPMMFLFIIGLKIANTKGGHRFEKIYIKFKSFFRAT